MQNTKVPPFGITDALNSPMYVREPFELDEVPCGRLGSRSSSSSRLMSPSPGLPTFAHHQQAGLVHRDVSHDQLSREGEEARDERVLPVLPPHRDPSSCREEEDGKWRSTSGDELEVDVVQTAALTKLPVQLASSHLLQTVRQGRWIEFMFTSICSTLCCLWPSFLVEYSVRATTSPLPVTTTTAPSLVTTLRRGGFFGCYLLKS